MKSFFLLFLLFFLTSIQVSRQDLNYYFGKFQIMNKNSKKVLDVADASKEDGAKVNQIQSTGAQNQRWSVYYEGVIGNGVAFTLISTNSKKALDNPGS